MHLALKAYQELLATVNEMDVCPDEAVRESSRIIKSEAWPGRWSCRPCLSTQTSPFPSQLHLSLPSPSFPDQSFHPLLFPVCRQHFLRDGVPGALPGSLSEV